MIIMQNIQAKTVRLRIKAFTLLESLVTLALVVFLTIALSGSVSSLYEQVEEGLFFTRFEYLYRDSQRLAVAKGEAIQLVLSKNTISNGYDHLSLPQGIHLDKEETLVFDAKGGNSSLSKIRFLTDEEVVSYQLYMGSGKFKKTIS